MLGGHGYLAHLACVALHARAEWDGVGDDHFLERRALNRLSRGAREEPVRGKREDATRAERGEFVGCHAQRVRGVDHVIDNDAIAAGHASDEVEIYDHSLEAAVLCHARTRDDHRERGAHPSRFEPFLEHLRARHAAGIRRDDHHVLQLAGLEVADCDRGRVQVVHRRARSEEALDLSTVQVDTAHAVDAHRLHHLGHVSCRDGHARALLPVLAPVPIVWHDGGHARGRRAPHSRRAQQQLHQVVVDRRARRLDDVHISVAHVLENLDGDLAVREASNFGRCERHAQARRDLLGELRVGVPREQLHGHSATAAAPARADAPGHGGPVGSSGLEQLIEHLHLAGAESLPLQTLLELGQQLHPGAAQLVALVVLLHDLLEPLGVDPHKCLEPAERAVRVVEDLLFAPLRVRGRCRGGRRREGLVRSRRRGGCHARVAASAASYPRLAAGLDASELVECQLDLRRVLDEGAVYLFQLVLERLEKLAIHFILAPKEVSAVESERESGNAMVGSCAAQGSHNRA